jgi:hypothetical protein
MQFKYVFDVVEDVGIGVIKNSAKAVWGIGETIIGATIKDDELLENGKKRVGETIIPLATEAFRIFTGQDNGDNNEEEEGNG